MNNLPISDIPACECGHDEPVGLVPELDARAIPHAIRHGAVIGAFSSLPAGGSMTLVTPHRPMGVLNQLAQLHGDGLAIEFLDEGPDYARTRLVRR